MKKNRQKISAAEEQFNKDNKNEVDCYPSKIVSTILIQLITIRFLCNFLVLRLS